MRIAIFVTNPVGIYGGGRLAAFVMAQCLASAGAEVAYVTNNKPVFYEELKHFGHPGRVSVYFTKDFQSGLPAGQWDVVVLVPTSGSDRTFYMGARGFARRRGAGLAMFSFETPNWFNSFSPGTRNEEEWREWRACIEDGCLVVGNSIQSMEFAKRYYISHRDRTAFGYWHQPINVRAANAVGELFRENRAVAFVRVQDPHKGGVDLIEVLSEDLRGWTLSLIVGASKLDEGYRAAIEAAAGRHGISIEVRTLVADVEKFTELKRARMLIYPSHFEGYGLPPIEALTVGTPCVCYDLPVFREVCGDALVSAQPGDVEGLRAAVRRVVQSTPTDWAHLPGVVAAVADIRHCGEMAMATLARAIDLPRTDVPSMPAKPRRRRPEPKLVIIGRARVDRGVIEIAGWSAVGGVGRVAVSVDGGTPAWANLGLVRTDVLNANPWLGTANVGFNCVLPCQPDGAEVLVRAVAFAHDGTVLDIVDRKFEVAAIQQAAPKPDETQYQRGGTRFLRESDGGAIFVGWVATRTPPLRLEVLAGDRRLWVQRGRARSDVMGKLTTFPPQNPGFAAHLTAEDVAALEAADRISIITTMPDGVIIDQLGIKWEALADGEPELAPVPDGVDPNARPVKYDLRPVTLDEYGVVEFDGWVLGMPRPDMLRFFLNDELLGEGVPDRLNLNIYEKNRAYADAYCGFQFVGRLVGAPAQGSRYRVEIHQGEAMAAVLEGEAQPISRGSATYGADAALLPPGLSDAEGPPVVALVVDDLSPLAVVNGAPLRALMAHLRNAGRTLLLVLHGNHHRFSDLLPNFRALADGVLLVNPLHPRPEVRRVGTSDRGSAALDSVIASLALNVPRLSCVMVHGVQLGSALGAVPSDIAVRRVLLDAFASPAPTPQRELLADAELIATWLPERTVRPAAELQRAHVTIGFDVDGLASQVVPIADPSLAEGRTIVLDGTRAAPGVVAAAVAAARAVNPGLPLAVVVDAAPLAPEAEVLSALGVAGPVTLLWPQAIAAAAPERIAAVVDLSAGSHAGPVMALAVKMGVPVAVWAGAANPPSRPWPTLAMQAIMGMTSVRFAAGHGQPYAALERALEAGAIPMRSVA